MFPGAQGVSAKKAYCPWNASARFENADCVAAASLKKVKQTLRPADNAGLGLGHFSQFFFFSWPTLFCISRRTARCSMHAHLLSALREFVIFTMHRQLHLYSGACTSCVLGRWNLAPCSHLNTRCLFSLQINPLLHTQAKELPCLSSLSLALIMVVPQPPPCPIGGALACPRRLQRASGNSASSPNHVTHHSCMPTVHSLAILLYISLFSGPTFDTPYYISLINLPSIICRHRPSMSLLLLCLNFRRSPS